MKGANGNDILKCIYIVLFQDRVTKIFAIKIKIKEFEEEAQLA